MVKPDPQFDDFPERRLYNLASALQEDVETVPRETLLAEAREDHGDARALSRQFDEIASRAIVRAYRRTVVAEAKNFFALALNWQRHLLRTYSVRAMAVTGAAVGVLLLAPIVMHLWSDGGELPWSDVRSPRPIRQSIAIFGGNAASVAYVSPTPDGATIVMLLTDGTVKLWNSSTKLPIATLVGHTARVNSVAICPDGRIVTASRDKTARVWDLKTGARLLILSGHTGEVLSASCSPDNRRIVTTSQDRTARLWDSNDGSLKAIFVGQTAAVKSATFTPDGRYVITGSDDGSAQLFDATEAP